jgi:peptide/nickel transport system substrate-binding protein
MDPAKGSAPSWEHERYIYSTLVQYQQFKLVPDLATSWDISADGKSYTFKLRPDVKFQRDFGPLTSEDVKFTLDRVMDPATKSPYASSLGVVQEVAAVDPQTVRITLKEPQSGFLYFLPEKVGWIVSKKAVQKFGDEFGTKPETTVGSGPYTLTQWTPRELIGFQRFKDYYDANFARIEQVTSRFAADNASRELAFKGSELDVISVTPESYLALQDMKKYQPFRSDTTPPGYYLINTRQKPLDDIRVRQAMAHAIDRKKVAAASGGLFDPLGGTIVPPSTFGYTDQVPDYPYDPQKAKQLLAEAGFPNGTPEIENPKHNNSFYPWDDVVSEMWRQVGINTKRPLMDDGAIGAKLFAGDGLIISDINHRPPHADPFFWDKFYSKNIKAPFYSGIDEYLLQARTTVDPEKQRALYAQAQRKLTYDDVAAIGATYYHWLYVAQPYVKNVHDDPGRRLPWAKFSIDGTA